MRLDENTREPQVARSGRAMSGLTAIVHLDGTPVDPKVLAACNAAAAHRGSAVAFYLEGPTAFAYLSAVAPPRLNVLSSTLEGNHSIVLAGCLYGRDEVAAGPAAGS